MNEEEIKRQLKLSKQQNKNERYDYLCSQFNCVNYAIKLEKYTIKLQQETKRLNGAIQTYDILLKANAEENKQLKEELEYTIGIVEHNRIISEKNKEIHQLKDNWNNLKKIAKMHSGIKKKCYNGGLWFEIDSLLDKMQELEQGSDNQ